MADRRSIGEALAPWAGGIAAPLLWWVHQRTVADEQFFHCEAGGMAGRALWSLLLIAAIAAAAWLSWRVWRGWGPHKAEPDNRRFVALVSLGVAGVLGLAVFFGALAALIVPDCYR